MPESFSSFRVTNPTYKGAPLLYTSNGLRTIGVIHPRKCNLLVLTGYNASEDETRFLQLFEAPPKADAVPAWVVSVPKKGQFSWVPAQGGRVFSRLHFAVSGRVDKYQAVAGQGFWIDAEGVALE